MVWLRLLEAKGLVTANYHLSAGRSGPGRSEVLYQPTKRAHALVAELAEPNQPEDWETIKRRLIDSFAGKHARDHELTEALLARVPRRGPAPVRYCLEVMTVVALRLSDRPRTAAWAQWLAALLLPPEGGDQASLSLLGGWALSVLASDAQADETWRREALAHLRRYQALVIEMDPDLCCVLSAGLREIFAPLLSGQAAPKRSVSRVRAIPTSER